MKIRLLGALVLICIMAILWPLIFDDAEEIRLSQQTEIPAPPKVEEWQVAERSLRPATILADNDVSAEVNDGENNQAETAAQHSSSESTVSNTEEDVSPMRDAWAIKVASLSDLENGSRLVEKLLQDGYRAYGRVSSVETGKEVMRIYIGPKFDKRRADSIKLEVDREYAVKSMVVPYQPDAV